MNNSVSPTFIKNLQANLAFWSSEVGKANGRLFGHFELEKDNLFLAIHYGLLFEESLPQTADLLIALFPSIEKRRETHQWGEQYRKIVKHKTKLPLSTTWQLTNRLGQIARLGSKYNDAIDIHERLLKQVQNHQHKVDPILFAQILFNLCRDHQLANDFKQAKYYAYQAIEEIDELRCKKSNTLKASILNCLGLIFTATGNYKEAIPVLQQSVSIWENTGEHSTVDYGRTIHSLAEAFKFNQEYKESTKFLQQAIHIFDQNRSYSELIRTQNSLGTLYQQTDQFGEAKSLFELCVSLIDSHSIDPLISGMVFHNTGNNFLFLKRFDQAEFYFSKAIQQWKILGEQINLGNSVGGLGEALEGQGLLKDAGIKYTQAIQLLNQFPNNQIAQTLKQEFNDYLENLGKKVEQAAV